MVPILSRTTWNRPEIRVLPLWSLIQGLLTPVREEFRPIFQVVRPRTRTFFGTWRAIEASFRASRDGISRRRSGPGDPKNGPKFRSDCREKTLNVRHLGQGFFALNDTELASFESRPTQISGLFPGTSGPNRGHFGHFWAQNVRF